MMAAPDHPYILRLTGETLPDKALIGGKAWSIAHMIALGLPVPPAFVITTTACQAFLETGRLPDGLAGEIDNAIAWLEEQSGRSFGGGSEPLLVSVRSGAPISMPGMMDTILNLGITDEAEAALAAESGDADFARDTHRRFFDLYAHIVLKTVVDDFPRDGDPASWSALISDAGGMAMPETARERLLSAVEAVFGSWNSRRAKRYRKHHNISDDLGTAVTVQAMVFGNLDENSGTGVVFSRNPLTGERAPYGEYLARAQGEDVVSGKFTPEPLETMRDKVPTAHDALLEASEVLETADRDAQDIEFTVQRGTLYLLQSRAAKRAPAAAVRMAVEMVDEGLIGQGEALARVTPEQVRLLLAPRLADGAADKAAVLASGDGASPGIGRGVVVADSDEAEQRAAGGEEVILARKTTSPEDVHGMIAATAIITEQGGSTSHAAVVSRALGVPCIVGCGAGNAVSLAGQTVTVDGTNGRVHEGYLDVTAPDEAGDPLLGRLAEWARAQSPLTVCSPDEAPAAGMIDLSGVEGSEEPDNLAALIKGHKGAAGGAIASDEGARIAVREGLDFIVGAPVLPLLIAACGEQPKNRDREMIAAEASE